MTHERPCEGGLALPTVMVLLALASVSTLLAWRDLWINEVLLKTEADQLRTQHKAQAVLPLAVQDIVGSASTASAPSTPNLRHTAGDGTQTHAFFPNTMAERDLLRQRLGSDACRSGICAVTPPTPNKTDPFSLPTTWKNMTASAMPVSASDTPYGAETAWYWVDIQPDSTQIAAQAGATSPTSASPFIYRITVLANGLLPSSTIVLQTLWTRTSLNDTRGQRHGWRILQD